MTDLDKLNKLREDPQYFKNIYNDHRGYSLRFMSKIHSDYEDIQDVYQDSVLVLYEKLKSPDFQLTHSIQTYLNSICRNQLITKHRKNSRMYKVDLEDYDSNITDWFNFAPNNSGRDGIKFTIDILKKYKKNILNKGQLIFPVLGLSNRDKLISFLKKKKIDYKILEKREWPLPKNLLKHQDILNKLKKRKLINYNIKFGILFTTTEIFCCKYNAV